MGNSTQQNEANGGTPLAEPTGSALVRAAKKARRLAQEANSADFARL